MSEDAPNECRKVNEPSSRRALKKKNKLRAPQRILGDIPRLRLLFIHIIYMYENICICARMALSKLDHALSSRLIGVRKLICFSRFRK